MSKEQCDEQLSKARDFATEYEQLCKKHGLRLGWEDDRVNGEPADIVMPYIGPVELDTYSVYDRGYLISIGKGR